MPEHSRGATRQGELLRGVFNILYEEQNGLRKRDVISRLMQELPPTEHEREPASPDRPALSRYQILTDWSTVDAKKSGWMLKESYGHWSLTDAGRQAFNEFPDPLSFFQEASKWKKQSSEDVTEDSDGNMRTSYSTLEDAEENAWNEIENHLAAGVEPYEFQDAVAGLLEGMGYYIHSVASRGPDGGVDIHASTDALNASGERIKVQVKRQQSPVSSSQMREFIGVLNDRDVGLYFSTGGFNSGARQQASLQQRRITLIDARLFFQLWEEHYERIPIKARRLLPIRRIAFLDLVDSQDT